MVQPELPAAAAARGVTGPVILEVWIDEKGNVSVMNVLRGDPLLNEAAKAAVVLWKYEPYIFSGRPIPTIKNVAVTFAPGKRSRRPRNPR